MFSLVRTIDAYTTYANNFFCSEKLNVFVLLFKKAVTGLLLLLTFHTAAYKSNESNNS